LHKPPGLEATGIASAEAEISREQLAEIDRVFTLCPDGISAERRAETQDAMLG
jgi:hypothetical protein